MALDTSQWRDDLRENPLILPLYLPTVMTAFSVGLLLPILPLFAASFQTSYGLVGVVLAGAGLGRLIGDVPTGALLPWLGVKWTMLLGLAVIAVSLLGLIFTQSLFEVLLLRLLFGFGSALYNISRHAYIVDAVAVQRRGRAIAAFGGVHRFGRFGAPAIGGLVAGMFGLRAPFGLAAIFVAFAFVLVLIFLKAGKYEKVASGHLGHMTVLMTLRAHYRVLIAAGAGQLFAQMIRNGRQVLIPLYAADVLGLEVGAIGVIVTIAAAIELSLFYPAGFIMDRYGRKYAIVPNFALMALGMVLVAFATSFVGLLLAASLMGVANGLTSGTMMTVGADLAPKQSPGEFLGLWRVTGDAGFSASPIIIGNVADVLTLGASAFAVAGAGLAAAAVFAIFVPETLKRQTPKLP